MAPLSSSPFAPLVAGTFCARAYSPLASFALALLVASLGYSSRLSLACVPFCDSSMKRAVRPVRVWVPVFLYSEVR